MPAPPRLGNTVLILSPGSSDDPQSFGLGRAAMRVAVHRKLSPVFPLAYCLAFMTQEEIGRRLYETTLWWYRRCAALWLCLPQINAPDAESPDLDPLTHDILLINEGLMVYPDGRRHFLDRTRLAVYQFRMPHVEDAAPVVAPLAREELSHYLRCNLTTGLFRGLDDREPSDEEEAA